MTTRWTHEDAKVFWAKRKQYYIMHYSGTGRRNEQRLAKVTQRNERENLQRDTFVAQHLARAEQGATPVLETEEARDLRFWIKHKSWNFCKNCGSLIPEKLLPSFRNNKGLAQKENCSCIKERYHVPSDDDVPVRLLDLSEDDIRILRPFDVHCGDNVRKQHGYRERTGPFRVTWSKSSVEEKIAAMQDMAAQRRLRAAYETLMSLTTSDYARFIHLRETDERQPFLYEIYSADRFRGIECALWPTLYYDVSMCESVLEGNKSRHSGKVSFLSKCYSAVADYQLHYEILHYQYDRWLFRTVTGAVNTAKFSGCSPATSLQHKTFSVGYWQWQHRFLVDAVRQYGYPSFFVTISPYEWSFPFPDWLESLRQETGRGATELPMLETLHIAHVLEQVTRGYLCGSNTNRWRHHLFNDSDDPSQSNIRTYFYRFEFQQRGTVHLHLLVWLQDPTKIRHELLRASIPWELSNEAYKVATVQKSDKSVLLVEPGEDRFEDMGNGAHLVFHYTQEDADRNIRAYIAPILASMQCRTDVQATDGKGMILKYVSSYVSKWHDGASTQGLYCSEVSGYQAACTFLRAMRPLEPEMTLQLSNIKLAWTPSRTKRITAPTPDTAMMHTSYQKYLKRKTADSELSFLEWLRMYNDGPSKPCKYRNGQTLVGVKMLSLFNPIFFYQFLAMHHPHSAEQELHHPQENTVPAAVRYFVRAVELTPHIWESRIAVRDYLSSEAHKEHFVETFCFYVSTLHDVKHLAELRVIDGNVADVFSDHTVSLYPLSPHQQAIYSALLGAVRKRRGDQSTTKGSSVLSPAGTSSGVDTVHQASSGSSVSTNVAVPTTSNLDTESTTDWRTIRVILGKAGTGKSQVLIRLLHQCFIEDMRCLVVAPVALLANHYRQVFSNKIDANTLHSVFRIPVGEEDHYSINFSLGQYDVIVLDEASMVSRATFDRMASTLCALPKRPVLIIAGDKVQQQPLGNVAGRVTQLVSILNDGTLNTNSATYTLYRQFRCLDSAYAAFLDHLRYYQATQQLLDTFQRNRVVEGTSDVTDGELWDAITEHTQTTILTVSKRATDRINSVVLDRLFDGMSPITNVPCHGRLCSFQVYEGMRVLVTENRDKESGLVNGQAATVVSKQNETVLLRMPNNKMLFTHPVSYLNDQGQREVRYPFSPGYGVTISKTQGATLQKVLLWLDCPTVPPGIAYVGLSRVRRLEDIRFVTRMMSSQVVPVIID